MSSKQSRSLANRRATVRLAGHLERHLLAYAAAASAGLLSSAPLAEAEIIYTPSNTPITIAVRGNGPVFTPLDLDNDGNPDFSFVMFSSKRYSSQAGSTTGARFFLKLDPRQTGNQAVQGARKSASAVPAGVTIGPQQKFGTGGLYLQGTGSRSVGTWKQVEYAYVGLKFLIDGQVHYGWARVKFPFTGGIHYPSIYGYAYESTPNQPIVAGQTSGSDQANTGASASPSLGMLAAGAAGIRLWRITLQ
jgi:hypothetical protein